MSNQLLLSLKEVLVSYHKKEIFKDLDLIIHRKDFIALVGKNGAGKSTLMNVLTDNHEIDHGEIWKIDNLKISYFNQNFFFNDESQTIEKEIYSILVDKNEDYQIDIFCNYLGLDKNSIIKNLSGGQKRRVGLIKTLINKSDILLLDEPTNHLDLDTIIWLDRSKIKINHQGYADFENWSNALLAQEERELQNRKQFVNIEVNWANKGVKARVKRNTRRLEQARELQQNLDQDISAFKKATKKIEVKLVKDESKNFRHVAEFHNASFYYNAPQFLLKNFNLKINKKDRIGLLGTNGSGKSTFLKILLGEVTLNEGSLKIRQELEFSYFDQLRNDLKDSKPIKKILVPSGGDYLKANQKERHVCSYLKDFHFDPSKANDPVGSLSGGMKNRLLLSKVLANPKSGLILDEPTNDLDTDTLDLVESILSEYNGTLIVVSHNRDFLDKLVNKILYFKGNGEVIVFNGGYHDFLTHKEELIGAPKELTNNDKSMEPSKKSNIANKKKLTFKIKFELDSLPKEIDKIKEDLTELEKILSMPNLFDENQNKFIETSEKFGDLQLLLEEKEDRWCELLEIENQ